MKRYLLFMYDNYYPYGGWSDFKGDFDTVEEAYSAAIGRGFDYYDIVDTTIKETVRTGRCK